MPLFLDPGLPAAIQLSEEGHRVYPYQNSPADTLHIGLVNLMPLKQATEYDFLQLMADDPRPIAVTLIETASHRSTHTSAEHLGKFYTTFDRISPESLDGIILTGAPLEGIPFEDVDYWEEITGIFNTIRRLKMPSLFICWAAFAAMYHWHGITWRLLPEKISGVFPHDIIAPECRLLQGVDNGFLIPHSRHATWDISALRQGSGFRLAASGDIPGAYLIESLDSPEFYICGHGEYSPMTLDTEYRRDLARGMAPHIPDNYYPDDDPANIPPDKWHRTALQIMGNWIELTEQNKSRK